MKMEKMKSKMKWVFRPANKSTLNGRGNVNVEDLEIRPGGLLVQKRNSDSNQNSVPIPSIKERRVQKYIETLDMLKLRNSINNRTEDKIPKQQEENSTGKKPIPMQKLVQQQILRHSESFVITTNWETFD
ncbi:hypothetical protein GH714_002026 [Hevea brasiliensis]|uniref:Uncharacterized protein n=1 Tax=Hevea brasiliensis TaxID=3981 RepID=A0A6A6L891_HEVBR|nr:hypothetical protein GH714_002026 [Hevea brasiliensis]